jgi:molybdopterin molybdotransferase
MDSGDSLLSVAEARARLLEHFHPLPTETIPLSECAGRVLAAEATAGADVPPFANSSMDGYAVRAAEARAGATLPVSADIPAGRGAPGPLAAGTAARIMTGAPLPPGADAVIPVEETDDSRRHAGGPAPKEVMFRQAARPGANVRPAGQDIRAGQVVLSAGRLITPAAVGVLASLGLAQVSVHRRPRVALFSTGDELREAGAALEPGTIHDTNSHSLAAAAGQLGAQAHRLAIAPDQLEAVRERLREARDTGADVIVSSAGVSVGAYDVVKAAVELDGRLSFWRVRMRPGKPLAFGQVHGVPYFGLPGNPVSALLTFEVFVRPALLKLAGRRDTGRVELEAVLSEELESDGRESYLRVVIRREAGAYTAYPAGDQGSAVLSTLVRANGLLILPAGVMRAQAGERHRVWLLEGAELA